MALSKEVLRELDEHDIDLRNPLEIIQTDSRSLYHDLLIEDVVVLGED